MKRQATAASKIHILVSISISIKRKQPLQQNQPVIWDISLLKKMFIATRQFFQGRLVIEPPLQWACSGPTRPVVRTNGTVGAAGDTSRPYKQIDLQGRLTHQPPPVLRFVGAAKSPAAPTDGTRINSSPYMIIVSSVISFFNLWVNFVTSFSSSY